MPSASVASTSTRVTPGSFTGYAFDRCQAPSQQEMDAWRTGSQYGAVGVYIAGASRFCDVQANLSAQWVAEQSRKGWRVLPITVGRQAACSAKKRWTKIDDDPANGYASARRQGRAEARSSVSAAGAYGIAEQSTLWLDLENFDTGNTRCRESALAFVFAWTRALHRLDYRSGFYSSASSGIRMVDDARAAAPGSTGLPDQIWIGDWNGRADVHTSYISDEGWMPHARMHQYAGGHQESHGGVRLTVDSSYLDVGRGSVPRREPGHCGVRVDFGNYWSLQRGDHNHLVAAMQCFLRKAGYYHGVVNGRFGRGSYRAVRRLQHAHPSLPVTGTMNRRTWTALLTSGSTPLLKYGWANDAVRRLQRGLNAARKERLDVDGIFGRDLRAAVKRYLHEHGQRRSGVVTGDVWALLQRGRR